MSEVKSYQSELSRSSMGDDTEHMKLPQENLIRVLLYTGHENEEINNIMQDCNFIPTTVYDLDRIYKDCIALEEGRRMLEENRVNRRNGVALCSYDVIREQFEFPDLSDFVISNPTDISEFLGLQKLIVDADKRKLIECSIFVDLPFSRLKDGWKKKFNEELIETDYNGFLYYFWNIKFYRIDQFEIFIEQNRNYRFYEDFKFILGFSIANFLSYFAIITAEEFIKHEIKLFQEEEISREERLAADPSSISKTENSQFKRRQRQNMKTVDHETKAEELDHKLQRIFARIVGKERHNLTRDQIKNKRRIKRIDGPNEQDEIIHP
jgi:hypothetical protein